MELANVRSFYTEAQKSPFKALPWKNGTMHFHYVPQVPALFEVDSWGWCFCALS